MATSVANSLPSISTFFLSNPPQRTRSTFGHGEFGCTCAAGLLGRRQNNSVLGVGCSLFALVIKQSNLRLPLFNQRREFHTAPCHQLLNSGTCGILPQIQNYHRHLQRRSRVKSGEAAEWTLGGEGMMLDEETLQQNLDMAIKEENFVLAAKLRDDLRLLHEDSKAGVLAANSRFYHAFRNGDLVAMRSIWAEGDNICCVHPGAGAISGYDLVMDSWEVVCGADHEFPLQIELKNVIVYVQGDVGYVTCLEVVKTKGSSWGKQVATNVFERVDGRWSMCIHHASHVDL